MRIFKAYVPDESDHQLILANSPSQAAGIAKTVWAESGRPQDHVKVVELVLPEGGLGLFNNKSAHQIDYFYPSQLANETAPVYDIHFKPVEPLSARLTLSLTF